jgi:hypothetical protein
MKITYKEVKTYRENIIKDQVGLCALCEHPLDNPCLDHDHSNGLIRGVLCRGCNCLLGKIENNMARNRITDDKLNNIVKNLIKYKNTHTELIHPIHNRKKRKKK